MMRQSIALKSASISVTAAALLLAAAVCAYAVPAPIGRVVRAEGEVSVRYRGVDSSVSVWRGDRVGPGDTLATGADGAAEVRLPGGTLLVLGSPAALEITGIAPRRAGDGKVVYDVSALLVSGAVRIAAPPGGAFTLSMGGGTIAVAASPETGADITAVFALFAWGEYAGVNAGCAFFTGPGSGPTALCAAPDPAGLRFGRGAPVQTDEPPIDLAFSEEPPAIEADAGRISEIIMEEKTRAPVAGGVSDTPAEELPVGESEAADPYAVAARFVRSFTAALSRGDTGALTALVSPDYSGSAGGAGRSALVRGVSDFYRAGGTLSVSAYVTDSGMADGSVIATMSFTSRVNGVPRGGSLRLWLSPDGALTHAEGQWVF